MNFFDYCKNGNLILAQEILIKNPNINISDVEEYAFTSACANGHISVVKWLYEIKPDIDISINNEYCFRWACSNGHIKIAKWLYEIKPDIDISINNEYSFRWTCFKGHLEVAKWLYEIKPDIDITANDDYAFKEVCGKGKIDIAQWLVSINNNYRLNVSNGIINYYKILIPIPILNEIIYVLNKELCFICSLNETDIITNCNHIFCTLCITEWYNQNQTCPYCRGFLYSFNKTKFLSFTKT